MSELRCRSDYKKIAGLETKSIPCPVCKKASKYIDYKVPKQQYTPPNENDDTTMGDETHIDHSKNQSIGKLQKIGTSHMYTLSLGINTIGRKAQTSNATVQIDTDDLTMSRSHSIIEVRKLKPVVIYTIFRMLKTKMPLISILD